MTSSIFALDCDIIIPTFHAVDELKRNRTNFVVTTGNDHCTITGYAANDYAVDVWIRSKKIVAKDTVEAFVLIPLDPFPTKIVYPTSTTSTFKDGEGFMFVKNRMSLHSREPNKSVELFIL